jgi:chemotaxis protein MotB
LHRGNGPSLAVRRDRCSPWTSGTLLGARLASATERRSFCIQDAPAAAIESFDAWLAPCTGRCMQSFRPRLTSLTATLALVGCVSQGKYDAALADSTRARADLDAHDAVADRQRRESQTEIAKLQETLAQARLSMVSLEQEVDFAGGIAMACGEALDESSTMVEQMQAELDRLGKDVDKLSAARLDLTGSLERARSGLEELRGAQVDAEARAAMFRDVAQRLRRMLDAKELKITLRSGRMVLVLPADILFDSGKAAVGRNGRKTLAEIGGVLATFPDRRFQVSGHTDSDPIRVSGFSSNWELSSARALEVVNVLIGAGMPPSSLSAAGYAEFDPAIANDSATHKAKNRRIEIALQPNIDELVELPSPVPAGNGEAPTATEPTATERHVKQRL